MKDYPFVRDLLDAHTVLFYHDTFTPELITAVSEAMDGAHPNKAASKKFYYILVESLQNVLRHQSDEPGLMQPFLLIRREGGRLAVTTGNETGKEQARRTADALDKIALMEPAALRRAYLEKMEEEGFSEAGGAGLGLLSMARKTGQPVTYRVEPLDDEKVCMMITVKL